MSDDFTCHDCGNLIDLSHTRVPGYFGGLGYARWKNMISRICYPCCSKREEAAMTETGKATLYLFTRGDGSWLISDWCGQLQFNPYRRKRGSHNISRHRMDVWFVDRHGKHSHGVNIGDNQILRCKRLKRRPA